MWRKTLIKQIAKNLSLTEEAYKAIAIDNEEASIEDYHQNKLLEQAKRPTETTASDLLLGVTKEAKETSQETRKQEAQFQLGYKGIISLLARA